MRVSIWQQWASNHSADFTVVGKFATQQKADQVATEIRTILQRIESWWGNLNPAQRTEWESKIETAILTPPEEMLRQEYEIDWPFSLAWYFVDYARTIAPVQAFDRLVIIENPHAYIWRGPQPFNGLLEKLGGEVVVRAEESQSFPNTRIVTRLKCTAPNADASDRIRAEIERAVSSEEHVPAWIVFHGGERDPDEQNLLRDAEIYFRAYAAEDYETLKRFSLERRHYLDNLMYGVRIFSADGFVAAEHRGLQLEVRGLRFDIERFIGLRSMIAWLREQGCSSIDYSFEERGHDSCDSQSGGSGQAITALILRSSVNSRRLIRLK